MPTEAGPDRADLYERHYLGLVRLAVHLVDDVQTAEDVVQDVFAAWPVTTPPDDALRYLRTAVVNRSRSALRRRRTARAFRAPVAAYVEAADAGVLRGERSREILAHVSRLPARQREVVILRFYLDLSVGDTATMLGVRPTAVTTSLSRALAALAHQLGDDRHDV